MIKKLKNGSKLLAMVIMLLTISFILPMNASAAEPDLTVDIWHKDANPTISIDITEAFGEDATEALIQNVNIDEDTGSLLVSAVKGTNKNEIDLTFISKVGVDLFGLSSTTVIINVEYEMSDGTIKDVDVKVELEEYLWPDIEFADDVVGAMVGDIPFETILMYNGVLNTHAVTYTSENESVATVDENGKVTIVGVGTAEIYASIGDTGSGKYKAHNAKLKVIVSNGFTKIFDAAKDEIVVFSRTIDGFDLLEVNNKSVTIDFAKKTIGGYAGFTGDIGSYKEGSTIITFYDEFLKYLQTQNVGEFNVTLTDNGDSSGTPSDVSTVTLYLRPLSSFTVSFDANGGTGEMKDVLLDQLPGTLGYDYKLPESGFTAPEGMEFSYWAVVNPQIPEEFMSTHEAGTNYLVEYDIEFVAVWEELPEENPETSDNIMLYVVGVIAAMITLTAVIVYNKKMIKNK